MKAESAQGGLADATPLVSIVIPVYNRERLIVECIASAQQQSYPNIEIIVSDSCSTDGTAAAVERLAAQDARIRLIPNASNLGPVRNWLTGLNEASGVYVKLLLSDDLLRQDAIDEQLRSCRDFDSKVSFCAVVMGEQPWQGGIGYRPVKTRRKLSRRIWSWIYLITENTLAVSPCAFLFERDLYASTLRKLADEAPRDFLDSGAGIDLLSIMRAIDEAGDAVADPEPRVFFRDHQGSISSTRQAFVIGCYREARNLFMQGSMAGAEAAVVRILADAFRWLKRVESRR